VLLGFVYDNDDCILTSNLSRNSCMPGLSPVRYFGPAITPAAVSVWKSNSLAQRVVEVKLGSQQRRRSESRKQLNVISHQISPSTLNKISKV
jgi:hypothetical protein